MGRHFYRITLNSMITYLAVSALNPAVAAAQPSKGQVVHFCGGNDFQLDQPYPDPFRNRRYNRSFAKNLNVGEPRTVRMIYFLPNDRPYRAEVVQRMKDEIRKIQTFYAEQMNARGHGDVSFRFETDHEGEPTVHHVDGVDPDSHYLYGTVNVVLDEIQTAFNLNGNIYLIVIDNSIGTLSLRESFPDVGVGSRLGKNGGYALVPDEFTFQSAAHELGHAFGLQHDFNDGAYLMSYGPGQNRLSPCHAEYLSVQPYFNSQYITMAEQSSTIEFVSPRTYPPGSQRIPVRLKVSNSEGIHQVLLFVRALEPNFVGAYLEVKACRGLAGEQDSVVEFYYDGVIPSKDWTSLSYPTVHTIHVHVVDMGGNVTSTVFELAETSPHHVASVGQLDAGSAVAFSPDGMVLAAGTGETVRLWDVVTQQNVSSFKHEDDYTSGVGAVSFSRNGRSVAAIGVDTVTAWDVTTGRIISNLRHTSSLRSVSFSPNTTTVAASGSDGTVLLWNVATQQIIGTLQGHTSEVATVAFSHDGTTLASGSMDRTVKLWDTMARVNFATLGHTSGVCSVAFSSNGTFLASGTDDGTVDLWNATGWMRTRLRAVEEIDIPDPNLRAVVATTIGVPLSMPIFRANMETLLRLNANGVSIDNLTGLESTTKLNTLDLTNNNVSDISAIAGLATLRKLNLGQNKISDIWAVTGLVNLTSLNLGNNSISGISAVANLTNLTVLNLYNNSVSDISAIANLDRLKRLQLQNNSISDISPLVANMGLGVGDTIYVEGNLLNYPSIHTHIPTLQAKGVDVSFNGRTPARLVKISGDQYGFPATPLSYPLVVEVQDEHGIAFAGVPVTFAVDAGAGTLSTTVTTTKADGKAECKLMLGPILETNTVSVSANEIETKVTFTAVAKEEVIIPDYNLYAAVETTLKVAQADGIVPSMIATLTNLDARNASISDLTGLKFAANLTSLNLEGNSVSDISALTGLTDLKWLNLRVNNISGISTIGKLTNLTVLDLSNNSVSNISAVEGLDNLTWLNLQNNSITDISPLVANTGLGDGDTVYVGGNRLNYVSIHTHIPTLRTRGVNVFYSYHTPAR